MYLILWKRILLFRNCFLFAFVEGTFNCCGNDGLVLSVETSELPLFKDLRLQDILVDKCRQLAGSQRKVSLEVSLGNADSRK